MVVWRFVDELAGIVQYSTAVILKQLALELRVARMQKSTFLARNQEPSGFGV